MKVAAYENYGPPDVLQFRQLPKPQPKDNELLVRSHAATVTSGDCRLRSLNFPRGFRLLTRLAIGLTGPRKSILGSELSGVVEAVGKEVQSFKVGDEVFLFTGIAMGCYAEFRCVKESSSIAHKPENLTFEEAAALSFGGTTALHFLRAGGVKQGDQVLINGASGSVGCAALQLARYFGAEVTGVCSAPNRDLVRSLGATHVIDYTAEDFLPNGKSYDIILDMVGTAPFSRCRHALKQKGRLLLVMGTLPNLLEIPWVRATTGYKVIGGVAKHSAQDLQFLADLARRGEYKAVLDKTFSFNDIVKAHRYVDEGHKRGNVILKFETQGS